MFHILVVLDVMMPQMDGCELTKTLRETVTVLIGRLRKRFEGWEEFEIVSMWLSQMATNVLNLTKVENQTILTDVTEYNLSEQIRSCILLLSEKWEQKNIEYALDFNEYTIHANKELLKQVWINLLGNAVKFTPVGGLIEVRITEQENRITVSVRNTGSEIVPEHQERIFNKFYQADESHASDGNGIGLAIVKRVVELHEGEISVSSGSGSTTFTVTLPK